MKNHCDSGFGLDLFRTRTLSVLSSLCYVLFSRTRTIMICMYVHMSFTHMHV